MKHEALPHSAFLQLQGMKPGDITSPHVKPY